MTNKSKLLIRDNNCYVFNFVYIAKHDFTSCYSMGIYKIPCNVKLRKSLGVIIASLSPKLSHYFVIYNFRA